MQVSYGKPVNRQWTTGRNWSAEAAVATRR